MKPAFKSISILRLQLSEVSKHAPIPELTPVTTAVFLSSMADLASQPCSTDSATCMEGGNICITYEITEDPLPWTLDLFCKISRHGRRFSGQFRVEKSLHLTYLPTYIAVEYNARNVLA